VHNDTVMNDTQDQATRRQRARRFALLLGLVAFLVYAGFIFAVGQRGG
jgi:uncharacterized membrane protein (DUF485 family)